MMKKPRGLRMDQQENHNYAAMFQVWLGAFLISFAPVLVRLSNMPSTAVGFYRVGFGGLTLLVIALIRRQRLWFGWLAAGFALLGGLFFAGDLFSYQIAIRDIGPGLATIIGNCQVFVLAIAGVVFLKEGIDWRQLLALPLVAVGLFMLIGLKWGTVSNVYHIGVYCAIATALCYGLYVLVVRQAQTLKKDLNPSSYIILICAAACLILGTAGYLQHDSFIIPDAKNWFYMLCYGIACQAAAWYFIAKGVTKIPVSVTGFILLTQPTLSFLWDVIFFHRPTPFIEWIGATITLFAIFLALQAKPKSKTQAVMD
ncbi:MAG: DMT family transporter [Gammaproteobacteria bacterium]|nr:DMT family transporter [Gammaproteobacteria bacterium]